MVMFGQRRALRVGGSSAKFGSCGSKLFIFYTCTWYMNEETKNIIGDKKN